MSAAGGSRAWLVLCALLGAQALLAWWMPAARPQWDWQPALAWHEPWRWFTAAGVHWSPMHLGANGLGLALVATLGWRAGCGRPATAAWALAWPLTHLALLLQPALAHYGGLSGVLHAGVAVAACQLLARKTDNEHSPRRRLVGALLLAGLLAKVLLESPWQAAVRHLPGSDIAIAPLAHAAGTLAGLLCGMLALQRGMLRQGGAERNAAPGLR